MSLFWQWIAPIVGMVCLLVTVAFTGLVVLSLIVEWLHERRQVRDLERLHGLPARDPITRP